MVVKHCDRNSGFLNQINAYFILCVILVTGWVHSADPLLVYDVTYPIRTFNMASRVSDPFPNQYKTLVLPSDNIAWNTHFIDPNKAQRVAEVTVEKIVTVTEPSLIPNSFLIRTVHQNYDVAIPTVVPVNWYMKHVLKEERHTSLIEMIKKQRKVTNNSKVGAAIKLITANIGKTSVSLNIKGDIYITGDVSFQDNGAVQTSYQDTKSWDLDITQRQNFTIAGNIGDRLSVEVDQDSEADFAWENDLVLNYDGRKDDIWQSGVAGNLSLSLPSSAQFVNGGTTKSTGLFGLKTVHQLGPLKITSIVSREQVKKSTKNISGGEASQDKTIHDYEFIKDKYFFIDDKFKNLFYPLDDNEHVPTNHVLKDYKLYKLDQSNGSIIGTAYLNGDTTSSVVENGKWKELIENTDYEILSVGTGVIKMLTSISQDAIGIGYIAGYMDSTNTVIVDEDNCSLYGDCAGNWDYNFESEPYEDDNNNNQWDPADEIIYESDSIIYFEPDSSVWYEDINGNLSLDEGEEIITSSYDNPTINDTGHILFEDGGIVGVFDEIAETYTDSNEDGLFTTTDPIILKLIKQSGQSSASNATWPLMLKNVYNLGARDIDPESFEIRIVHEKGDTGEEEESPNNVSFLHIFGLDNQNSQGLPVDGGDGIFDPNPNLVNFTTGELFLPMHLPFAYDTHPRVNFEGLNMNQQDSVMFDIPPGDSLFWGNHHPELKNTVSGEGIVLNDPDNNFNTTNGDHGPSFYYNTSSQNDDHQFDIVVKHSQRSSSINLGGFMIVEGSEEVRLGGRLLRKDMDYNIDYFGGTLNFNSVNCPECLEPTADIQVSFEENELVSFDQKIMVGTAMEFNLSENFQLGGVAMYYNQSIVDEKVDIGYEPVRNFIWDINGKYALKNIDLLTNFVDNLPFVETDKPSNFSIEGEFAEVLPNPNPLGEAYLDDFESSKRTTSLGILQRNWKLSSPPLGRNLADRSRMAWYNPSNDVLTNSIWPDLQVSTRANTQTTKVLVLQSLFQSDVPNDSLWSGVTTALYPSEYQQSDSKYLDVWLNSEGVLDDSLRLHIDIGFISEDINEDNQLNTEDRLVNGFGNHILDGCVPGDSEPCEDVGLDGCTDERENGFGGCLNEPGTYASPGNQAINTAFWVDPNDPNGDNWSFELHQQESLNNYRFINGTEGNGNTPGFTFPDTEDLDNDDSINKRNDYFTYTLMPNIDEPVSATENGGILTGWKLFRILLSDFTQDENGSVLWSDVEYARLWMDGIPPETDLENTRKLMIAKFEIVRNEWLELGVAHSDLLEFIADPTFSVAVANTDENSDYDPPPGVQGEYDEYYGIRQREQSLVLSFNKADDMVSGGIEPNHIVAVNKTFSQGTGFDPLSFKAYKNMEMYVFGGPEIEGQWNPTDSSTVNFVFKFGKDNDNYYQVMKPIYPEWDERNHINIDIQNLVRYKLNIESLDDQPSTNDVGLDSTTTAKENGCGSAAGSYNYEVVLAAIDSTGTLGYATNPNFYQETFQDTITVCGTQYWEELVNGEPRCPTCNLDDPNGDNYEDCEDETDTSCVENLSGTEGNGQFDFIDSIDPNGLHDFGELCEPFDDVNQNGQFDPSPDNFNDELGYWEWVDGECPDCKTIRIKGSPAIDRINFITLGVENNTDEKVYGQVLVDELRMTGVKKERGRKMRVRTSLNFADLMDFSVDFSQEDANFHSLRQRLGTGNTTNKISVNSKFNPDKFLPTQWGIKTPLTVNYSNTVTAPKYYQGTDILTGSSSQMPDSIKTINQSLSFNTSFRKTTPSGKWYLKYTIDNITIDNLTAKYSFNSNNTIQSDVTHDYSGKITYKLSFGDNYIRPFKKLENIPFIGAGFGETRLYWTPKLFTTSMNVTSKDKVTEKRSGTITEDPNFKMTRRFSLDYQLSKNVISKYSKTINSDLIEFNKTKLQAIEKMNPGNVTSIDESLNNSFSPDILKWLKPRLTYNTSFSWGRQNLTNPVNTSSNSEMGVSSTLNLKNLIETIYTPTNQGSSSRSGQSRRNSSRPPTSKKKEIKNPILLAIIKPMHSVSSKISNISITYKNRWSHQFGSVEGRPDMLFKLGISGDSGLPLFEDLLPSYKHEFSNDLALNTTVSITQKLSTTVKYNMSDLRREEALKDEYRQVKKSFIPFGDRGNEGIPMFTWSINWSGFEKLPLVNKVFKTMSFSHAYQGEQVLVYDGADQDKSDYNISFSPLLGVNAKTKWKTPLDVSLNVKHNVTIKNDGASTTKNYTNGVNSSFTYRHDGGLNIPLFFFRDFDFENKITLTLNMSYDKTDEKFRSTYDGDFQNRNYTTSFNFKPNISYSFTKYVDGGIHFSYSINDGSTTVKRTEKDFGFDVHIKIIG